MNGDNKNLILAITLSFLIFFGWRHFFDDQKIDLPAPQETAATSVVSRQMPNGASVAPQVSADNTVADTIIPREQLVADRPHIIIDTPKIIGSIALKGGRIDDVSLRAYRETVDPDSPHIVLMSPAGTLHPYYADFGWVSGAGKSVSVPTSTTVWSASSNRLTLTTPVTLTWNNGAGLTFSRTIAVDSDAMFTITDSVVNASGEAVTLHPWSLISRRNLPKSDSYYLLHEGLIGVLGNEGLKEYRYADLSKNDALSTGGNGVTFHNEIGGFLGITDKYWASALIPPQDMLFTGRFSERFVANQPVYQVDILGAGKTLADGSSLEIKMNLFAGAKEVNTISKYEKEYGIKNFDLLIDWGWFYFITKPMFWMLDFFYKLIGNFGVAILIVTVLVKLAFLPLANRSYASMAKMKAVQPEMLAIRERYKDDRAKQQQAMMELYKTEKINPVAGCWPMLVQIPVFFALYKVLFITIEMRHAPFFGWIRDLSSPDPLPVLTLFGLIPWDPSQIPVVGAFLMIGLWPIIMGVTMFVQMRMNPAPADPIQQSMFTWMPVLFTFMLASFPAGLVIYWSWNNTLSVIQQGYIMRKNGVRIELWDNLRNIFRKKVEADN